MDGLPAALPTASNSSLAKQDGILEVTTSFSVFYYRQYDLEKSWI